MPPLVQIQNLGVSFRTDQGTIRAVDDVSFEIGRGETLGLVGESGCGKSVTALSILRLVPRPPGSYEGGRILFDGVDLLSLPVEELRRIRGARISMIFQEPMSALSPLVRVGKQLVETQQLHRDVSRDAAWATGIDWLRKVGIPEPAEAMHRYPFELSGGMRQRVMIAMALMLEPELVIADEPTTALDVTIQAQIFDLLRAMKTEKTSLLLITHDMGAVWEMCDRMVVMYASQVVEEGSVREVFARPRHPYTKGLLAATSRTAPPGGRLPAIPGQVPWPGNYPAGCHFADRCSLAVDACRAAKPSLLEVAPGRKARCIRSAEVTP